MAGAKTLVRAYFAAAGKLQVEANVSRAQLLPRYVLPGCTLCVQIDTNQVADAVRAASVHGRVSGGQYSLSDLLLEIQPGQLLRAAGSVRFSYSAAKLVDRNGRVVAQGPGVPLTTYLLALAYAGGQWRIATLLATP